MSPGTSPQPLSRREFASEPAERAYRNVEHLLQTLFAIEDDLGLFELEVAGVRFWERIRPKVFDEAASAAGLRGTATPRRPSRFQAGLRSLRSVVRSPVSRNPFWRARADIAFWGNARRKPDNAGRWLDIYCDPVIGKLAQSGLDPILFEYPWSGKHFVPAHTRRIRYMEPVHLLAAMTRQIRRKQFVLAQHDWRRLHALEQEINGILGVRVDLLRRGAAEIAKHNALLPWIRNLLAVVQPKLVILTASHGKEALIQACRETGVTTAELQHGLVGPLHPDYAFPGRGKKALFPDYFLAFGDYWRDITPFPIPRDHIISVGFPYFEEERRKVAAIRPRNQIVFLSQPTIGKGLSKLAIAAANDARIAFDIIYKLHPAEYAVWRRDYPWLHDGAVTVIDQDRIPLYRLLAESRLQVGCTSTALFEGIGLGVPTCVAHLLGSQQLRPLIDRGAATPIESVDDLFRAAVAPLAAPSVPIDELFRPQALHNIQAWIEAQIGNAS